MVDPVVKALEDINRTLKDFVQTQKALNQKLLALLPKEDVPPLEGGPKPLPDHVPTEYGWSMAALLQREGGLKPGDVKIEKDDSRWVWIATDTRWERVEEPSAREPD